MGIDSINIENFKQLLDYTNDELRKGRTIKSISIDDFQMSEDWLRKKLTKNGYKMNKVINQYEPMEQTTEQTTEIIQNKINTTTKPTTDIIQNKSIQQEKPKKAFNNDEVKKLDQLLNIDIDVLNQMINEYTTKKNTSCSIEIKDNTTTVTSLRLNKSIYALLKEKAQIEGLGISELINKCMIDYLNK